MANRSPDASSKRTERPPPWGSQEERRDHRATRWRSSLRGGSGRHGRRAKQRCRGRLGTSSLRSTGTRSRTAATTPPASLDDRRPVVLRSEPFRRGCCSCLSHMRTVGLCHWTTPVTRFEQLVRSRQPRGYVLHPAPSASGTRRALANEWSSVGSASRAACLGRPSHGRRVAEQVYGPTHDGQPADASLVRAPPGRCRRDPRDESRARCVRGAALAEPIASPSFLRPIRRSQVPGAPTGSPRCTSRRSWARPKRRGYCSMPAPTSRPFARNDMLVQPLHSAAAAPQHRVVPAAPRARGTGERTTAEGLHRARRSGDDPPGRPPRSPDGARRRPHDHRPHVTKSSAYVHRNVCVCTGIGELAGARARYASWGRRRGRSRAPASSRRSPCNAGMTSRQCSAGRGR